MLLQDGNRVGSDYFSFVLMQAEEDCENVVSVLQFLHVAEISRAQSGENLGEELLICCKELSNVVWVFFIDAIVIDY